MCLLRAQTWNFSIGRQTLESKLVGNKFPGKIHISQKSETVPIITAVKSYFKEYYHIMLSPFSSSFFSVWIGRVRTVPSLLKRSPYGEREGGFKQLQGIRHHLLDDINHHCRHHHRHHRQTRGHRCWRRCWWTIETCNGASRPAGQNHSKHRKHSCVEILFVQGHLKRIALNI